MSNTIINLSSYINGLATDVTSVVLSDSSGTYGLKRTDTGAIVQAANTPVPRISTGVYQLSFVDPASSLIYDYVLKIVYNGETRYYPRTGSSAATLNHLYTIPTSTHYSSEAEVMRILGEATVELMMSDWEVSDRSPIWEQILTRVDTIIDQYVGQHYARANIVDHAQVRSDATWMAAHFLSMRRGNPGLFVREMESIYSRLEDIRDGRAHIHLAIPLASTAPVIRNYRLQPFSYHPVRVIQSKSTGEGYERPVMYAWEPYLYFWHGSGAF